MMDTTTLHLAPRTQHQTTRPKQTRATGENMRRRPQQLPQTTTPQRNQPTNQTTTKHGCAQLRWCLHEHGTRRGLTMHNCTHLRLPLQHTQGQHQCQSTRRLTSSMHLAPQVDVALSTTAASKVNHKADKTQGQTKTVSEVDPSAHAHDGSQRSHS